MFAHAVPSLSRDTPHGRGSALASQPYHPPPSMCNIREQGVRTRARKELGVPFIWTELRVFSEQRVTGSELTWAPEESRRLPAEPSMPLQRQPLPWGSCWLQGPASSPPQGSQVTASSQLGILLNMDYGHIPGSGCT